MKVTNEHVRETYYLLSEIDPSKKLNVAIDLKSAPIPIPFSHSTRTSLKRLQALLGKHSKEVTPHFSLINESAYLDSLTVGAEFKNGKAAALLEELAGKPPSLNFDADATNIIINKLPPSPSERVRR